MKKIILVFSICFASLMIFISCNRGAEQSTGRKFGYTCFTMNNPFFITIADSIKEELAKNGDTLIVLDPQLDQAKQISQIEDMISQGIDLMFLNPVDWKGVKPALDALKAAGIPIVNFDAEVYDKDLVDSVVVSDNFQAGFVCGQDLVKYA